MSYRRSSPPPSSKDADRGSSSSRSYGSGRGGYSDRRGPSSGRDYRDDYDRRVSRRSRSPPHARGDYSNRDRRYDRQGDRRDRDYPREAPPLPRDDRASRHAGPPPPIQEDSRRNRYASPPRRAERDRQADEERSQINTQEPTRQRRESAVDGEERREDGSGEDGEVQDDAEAAMMAAMGFGGFGTTKNTKVDGNQIGAAEVKKERTWRQYMQRKGGFNRPLSPVRKG